MLTRREQHHWIGGFCIVAEAMARSEKALRARAITREMPDVTANDRYAAAFEKAAAPAPSNSELVRVLPGYWPPHGSEGPGLVPGVNDTPRMT